MSEGRWEHALHETKGLGKLRRDIPAFVATAVLTFAGLRIVGDGSVADNLLTSVLVGFGVLVVLPLFELLRNYRRAPAELIAAEEIEGEEATPELERERYRALSERLRRGGGTRPGGPGPE